MPLISVGNIVYHLNDGSSVDKRRLDSGIPVQPSAPTETITVLRKKYFYVEKINGKRISAISFYCNGRVFTLSGRQYKNDLGFFFGTLPCKNIINYQILGLVTEGIAILKQVSLSDYSETTRVVRRH